jgi:protein-S-isoprenylcysteine O-methyltransferase Ste14
MIEMDEGTRGLSRKALFDSAKLVILLGILLFIPAWSLHFWQAWIFWLVLSASGLAITLYFLKWDPSFIERRLPAAEKEGSQKVIQVSATLFFVAEIVVSGLDHRFHWSHVPPVLVVLSDLLVAMGFAAMFQVFKENRFASSIIEVNRNQSVISTGPYRIVRHPMYAGALLMQVFTPLALGSYWALLSFPLLFSAAAWRLVNEEKFLATHLPGYDEYRRKTRYRLIPFVW